MSGDLTEWQARDDKPPWVLDYIATRDPDTGRLRVPFNQHSSTLVAAEDAEAATGLRMEVFRTDTGWAYASVEPESEPAPRPCCTWGGDAWHRAVTRLTRLHRPDYRRLLAEERAKTGGEQP